MFRSLIRIAVRNIFRDLSYSIINILGLTIGITGSLFLLLYVYDELSYDKYNEYADRIFRISSRITEPDDAFNWAVTQMPLAPQLKADYPEVEESVRLIQSGRHLYRHGENEFFEEEVSYADSNIFRVFSFPLIEGNPATALTQPNSIVLTRSFANRYFQDADPIGQTLEREDGVSFRITGVTEDVPGNSNYNFSALISRNSLPEDYGSWGAFHIYTYILLQEGYDYREFEAKLPQLYTNHMAEIFEEMGISIVYDVLPVTRIHLHSDFQGEQVAVGNISYVYIFIAIIALMLLIASINYMNLATARSTRRSREIAIRKVSGSTKAALIMQFLTESLVLALLALVISLVLCYVLLPVFNEISGKAIGPEYLGNGKILWSIAGIVLFTGLLGGSYPAFHLSSFNPGTIMKGTRQEGRSRFSIRQLLVILQFTLSTAMVISTWIVYDQLTFLKNKDLGFEKDNTVVLNLTTREMVRKLPVFRNMLLENPKVSHVGSSDNSIGFGTRKSIMNVETSDGMVERGINNLTVDHDFINALGIRLIEGRDFSEDYPDDTLMSVIVNQTLAKRLNWDDPIGKKVSFTGDSTQTASVVGLIGDYFQFGLYNAMESVMLLYYPWNRVVFVKVNGADVAGTLDFIREQWNALYSGFPFEYSFLDENFNRQFEADERRGTLFTFFSVMTVLVACLGLFGLASYVTERRTREIGIRKVFGAGSDSIVRLLLSNFMTLILISILLSTVVSYLFARNWLESFVYQTDIKWTSFVLSALLTIMVTVATVSLHTLRTSNSNPADTLRYE